ncbi:MAG: hypothetical protein ACQCN6_07780 [Candidatus Bathyarchaeia archaeon]|jgi:hypothetical protein
MPRANKSALLLLLIFTFAFLYRMLLMFWSGYPPGADIGLHNSVIYSIVGSGPTDLLYNFYHIGGGISLTFPGYHIFTAGVMMITGMTAAMEPFAQALVVSLFSALIVLAAFLITRRVWSTAAAFIVAFLVAISRFDIEMLMWAGYPNVITLMLIPLTFYLYLEKDRFSNAPFLVSTSILAASMLLTHSLSAVMFGLIAAVMVFAVLVFPAKVGAQRKTVLYWILPVCLGAILVSPFLVQAIPTYLAQYGSDEIAAATVATRILPLEVVLPLFLITAAFFIFSKKFYNKFLAVLTLLFAMWIFLPLILTQGYLVGLPVDYNRFLYFLVLPVLVFIAILVDYGSGFFAESLDKLRSEGKLKIKPLQVPKQLEGLQRKLDQASKRLSASLTQKRIYSVFVLFLLLFCFAALPIFTAPSINFGETLQNYYQTMNNEGWDALQWIKTSTPQGSVIVSDALYGWWLGGFAQRPTLSAVSPEYLTVKREVDNASFARNLMGTDYIVDNGWVEVQEDGYLSRHNPEILIDQNWTYAKYSFFTFSNQTEIYYSVDGSQHNVVLSELAVKTMRIENDTEHATITVTRGNDDLNYTLATTIYRQARFVNITSTITALSSSVNLEWANIKVDSNGEQIPYGNPHTVCLIDEGVKALGQLIFYQVPYRTIVGKTVEAQYNFADNSSDSFQIMAGAYSVDNTLANYANMDTIKAFFQQEVAMNLESPLRTVGHDGKVGELTVFNYRSELQNREVSYVVCRDQDMEPKFRDDPLFSLVFINKEVAIFKVNGNLSQG